MMVAAGSKMGSRAGQIATGLFVAGAFFAAVQWAVWSYRGVSPISEVFTASVAVPDFYQGDDPLVIYDRDIKQTFIGDFTVEVKGVTEGASQCTGGLSGVTYDKGEKHDPDIATLSWYVVPHPGKGPCLERLKPGQYYLETNYIIRVPEWPARTLRTVSNVFSVLSRKE